MPWGTTSCGVPAIRRVAGLAARAHPVNFRPPAGVRGILGPHGTPTQHRSAEDQFVLLALSLEKKIVNKFPILITVEDDGECYQVSDT